MSDITGALLYDTGYPEYLLTALTEARQNIYVTMFYMAFAQKKKGSLVNKLVTELAGAQGRGVNVKVVLDKDRETDPFLSRVINKEAFDYLSGRGVAVRFDSVRRLTHSKVVVVDGMHVFIGSHNWTLDSFFKYNETSVYLRSPRIAAHYVKQFDSRW